MYDMLNRAGGDGFDYLVLTPRTPLMPLGGSRFFVDFLLSQSVEDDGKWVWKVYQCTGQSSV